MMILVSSDCVLNRFWKDVYFVLQESRFCFKISVHKESIGYIIFTTINNIILTYETQIIVDLHRNFLITTLSIRNQ